EEFKNRFTSLYKRIHIHIHSTRNDINWDLYATSSERNEIMVAKKNEIIHLIAILDPFTRQKRCFPVGHAYIPFCFSRKSIRHSMKNGYIWDDFTSFGQGN